ncbi:endocuticle structural glycoprotein SgAbd-4 [Leptinotarsa decemlineata]|uniref:endocuticle structural glycoprotein SgAbd-4 n=1 Tax=Leptinotarsa decemlineata TaxID=7539 RepID=UPI003D307FC9
MRFLLVIQIISLMCSKEQVCAQESHYRAESEDNNINKNPIIPIIKSNFEQYYDGYKYSYETGNGIQAYETGIFKHKGDEKHETLVQQGSVTYHDEHGKPITLTYIADEHGFQPQGDHLPTSPTIPESIQKALVEQNHNSRAEVNGEQRNNQEQEPGSYRHEPKYYNY